MTNGTTRALLVDLNNYARYPTLAIGYLVAALRQGGIDADVLTPLSHGVPAVEREHRETTWDQMQRRVFFSTHPATVSAHELIRSVRARRITKPHPKVLEETGRMFDERRPDVLLLSAYLEQRPSVEALAALAAERGVPVILGGPVFNIPQVARAWIDIPGLTAIVGAEVDLTLADLVHTAASGGDLGQHAGVLLPDGGSGPLAPPLHELDRLPVPDFSDFPWDRYPMRVIPAMTGRGCSWGKCLFCSDVVTANGRGFRSRPVEAVLDEIEQQAARYRSRDFIFLDIKLNSDLRMWRGLLDGFQRRVPGGRWIGTLHVAAKGENGFTKDELEAAAASGLTRTTFGLESGSDRLNDTMAKGTRVERTSQFVRDAHAAGISVRTTAMLGYPGETPDDIAQSIAFFQQHERYLDRVRLSRFAAIPGTGFHERYERRPDQYTDLTHFEWSFGEARARYRYAPAGRRAYRRRKTELLNLVHRINSRPLRTGAEAFDGLM